MSRRAIAAGCAGAVVVVVGLTVIVRAQREGNTGRDRIDAGTIVMVGDSITAQADWSVLLPEWPIANRGYAGFTTAQLVDVAEEIASRRPRAIFVLTGTNDIRDEHPASWTADRLAELIGRLRRGAPDTVVVLQTVLPRADARRAVTEINDVIRGLATEWELQVLDLYAAFDDGTGALRPAETTDGIHLTSAGNRRWATELDRALRALESPDPLAIDDVGGG